MRPLANGYKADVDTIHPQSWCHQVSSFSDANLYQLWRHGAKRTSFSDTSRLLLRRSEVVVAAAEVRLFQVPWTGHGIAYVRWGPVRRGQSGDGDPEVFRQTIRALRNEYVRGRGFVLRIVPRLFVERDLKCLDILADEGFSRVHHVDDKRSLIVSLSPSLNELRRGFTKKWRNSLNKAERSGLTTAIGTDVELFDDFIRVYNRMLRQKCFVPTADLVQHRRIQSNLPDTLKMRVVLARAGEHTCAGALVSTIGDTALYLFGASDDVGRRTCASYLVQWQVIRLLKEAGFEYYDLNGINPARSPGVYHFKKGLAGVNGREVSFIGHFEAFESSFMNRGLILVDRLRYGLRTARVPPGWFSPRVWKPSALLFTVSEVAAEFGATFQGCH